MLHKNTWASNVIFYNYAVEYFLRTQSIKYIKKNKIGFYLAEIMEQVLEAEPRFNCADPIRPTYGVVEAGISFFNEYTKIWSELDLLLFNHFLFTQT